jgi:hypothetical protein
MPIKYARPKQQIDGIWITNISKNIVSLGDLAVHIQPFCSVNLSDFKNYHLTEDQILKSIESGSIFTKNDKIIVRVAPPPLEKPKFIPQDHYATFPIAPIRKRYSPEIDNNKYEELNLSDDEYAKSQLDNPEQDNIDKRNK